MAPALILVGLAVVWSMWVVCPRVLSVLGLGFFGWSYFWLSIRLKEAESKKGLKKKEMSFFTHALFSLLRIAVLFILLFGGVPLLTTLLGGVFPGRIIDIEDRALLASVRKASHHPVTVPLSAPFLEWKVAGLSAAIPFGLFLAPSPRLDATHSFLNLVIGPQQASYLKCSCPLSPTVVHITVLSCFIMEPFCIPSYDMVVFPPCAMEADLTQALVDLEEKCPWEHVCYHKDASHFEKLVETCNLSVRDKKKMLPLDWVAYFWPERIIFLWKRTDESVRCARPDWNILHRAAHVGNFESVRTISSLSEPDLRTLWYRDAGLKTPLDVADSYKPISQNQENFRQTIELLRQLKDKLNLE